MVYDARLMQLIQGLHRGTRGGKIHWVRTGVKGVYLANFPEYAVRISVELPGKLLVQDKQYYYLRIYNDNGDMVEEITDAQLTKTPEFDPREVMIEIYNMARSQAMGADEAIDALLKVLQ
jgi:hypothetical protein